MKRIPKSFLVLLLLFALLGLVGMRAAYAQGMGLQPKPAVVQVVMFWMDTCGHCHYVIDEVIKPLQEQYGDQLEVYFIELASYEDFDALYQTAEVFGIPKENVGVPFLLIGDQALVGSMQIPAELPGLIEKHLAAGGVEYPDAPALVELTGGYKDRQELCAITGTCPDEAQPTQAQAAPVAAPADEVRPPAAPPLPSGYGLAIGVMAGMVVALGYTGIAFFRGAQKRLPFRKSAWREWATPLLALVGLGVAGYLGYVETLNVPAICGPVGDCNIVQSSPYAYLFGVLPVGVLGSVAYLVILAAWFWERFGLGRLARYAPLAVFSIALAGALFSLYLTYLEPFVIKAVCAWCLASAVIITLLLLLSRAPAQRALAALSVAPAPGKKVKRNEKSRDLDARRRRRHRIDPDINR